MSNMSYCRFENTSRDLADCVYAMQDGEVELENLNEYELPCFHEMARLCKRFLTEYENIVGD